MALMAGFLSVRLRHSTNSAGERLFKGGKRSNQPLAYRFEGEF
jgi:hypothetical protein